MRAYAQFILLSFFILVSTTACNDSDTEETSNAQENKENEQQEVDLEDAFSPNEDKNREEAKDTSEENKENEGVSEPGIYDPEEVSGRENPDADGNVVYPEALENLELPYIYENTLVYSGTVNPDQGIRFELLQPDSANKETVDPDVSEEGYFTIALNGTELEAGDELIIYIIGDMPHEQQLVLPIQPAEEGMELVEKISEKTAVEEIKQVTDLPEFYENTTTYYGKTSPEAIVNVSEIDPFTGDTMELEADENGDFSGDFSNFPYQAKGESGLQEGQMLLFTMTDVDGHVALFLSEIQPPSDDPQL
ncbi:hypothetical protein AB4Y30_08300 [Ornithinibacillus sp. 4-3]|uniref:Uncharacterized protein n=1 Tax=Ornithinibacillus sp. 4-3 TaxID=3231488 RepID=A0AB39HUF0_9BACI